MCQSLQRHRPSCTPLRRTTASTSPVMLTKPMRAGTLNVRYSVCDFMARILPAGFLGKGGRFPKLPRPDTLPVPMKSDRRHELQTNTLALWLQLRLPELWNKYGSWFLFGLVTIMALVLFIQYRVKQPKIALANASRTLAEVQMSITRLEQQAVPLTEVSDVPARI